MGDAGLQGREGTCAARGGSSLKQIHILPPRKQDNLIIDWAEIKRHTQNEQSNETNFSVCLFRHITRRNIVLFARKSTDSVEYPK
jgi:hypothetical protein